MVISCELGKMYEEAIVGRFKVTWKGWGSLSRKSNRVPPEYKPPLARCPL